MVNATFGNISINDVVGYRIAAAWAPNHGFQSNFFVYVWDMNNATAPFEHAVSLGKDNRPTRANLTLEGAGRSYGFNNIDLISAQIGATRAFRYRLLEFQYDQALLAGADSPITVQNDCLDETTLGSLGEDFTYSLGGGGEPEHLLGFRYRPGAGGANVVRFSSLRNNKNCFLEKVIQANKDRATNKGIMKTFQVSFSQGTLDVKQENLLEMYVEECYGYMLGEPQSSLSQLIDAAHPDINREAVVARMEDYSPRELLTYDRKQVPRPRENDPRTVETATFVFRQGNYQNLEIK